MMIPVPRLIGQDRACVNVPAETQRGDKFLFFLATESAVFERHAELFRLTCSDLLIEGWHIHRHDVILEYENWLSGQRRVLTQLLHLLCVSFEQINSLFNF